MNLLIIFIGIIVFLLYALPLAVTKLNFGNVFGIFLGLFITVAGLFYEKILMMPYAVKIIIAIASIGFFSMFIITLFFIIIKSRKNAENKKTVIVLGCRVKWDRPSLALIERCNTAFDFLMSNPDSVAVLSGGKGKDEKISEAKCMFDILTTKGISPNRLYLEDKSTSTYENIRFSKEIIRQNNLSRNVAIATSEYHLFRAYLICKNYGMTVGTLPAKTLNFVKIPIYTREVFGVWALLLKLNH